MTSQSDKVLEYTQKLCEVLRTNHQSHLIATHRGLMETGHNPEFHREEIEKLSMGEGVNEYYVDTLRKYYKVVMKTSSGSRSAHLFVDKETGDCYKSASWKSPSKGIRYNLLDDKSRQDMYGLADWVGSYLYSR